MEDERESGDQIQIDKWIGQKSFALFAIGG